jgi:hypothetical protein
LGTAATTNASNLTSTLASADQTAQGQQLSAASYLSQIFSSSASQYFNSSTTGSSINPTQIFSSLFPGGV